MAKETYPTPGRTPTRTPRIPREHSEFPSPETKDARIREKAGEWRVTHVVGEGKRYTMTTDNFEWAQAFSGVLVNAHQRVTLYCLDGDEAVILPPSMWDGYLMEWKRRETNTETRPVQAVTKSDRKRAPRVARTERLGTRKG